MLDVCKKCTEFHIDVSSKYCKKCGSDYPYYQIMNEDWHDNYKTIEYKFEMQEHHDVKKYNEALIYSMKNRIQGIKQKWYPSFLISILKDIPEPCYWKDVWTVYKNYGVDEIWRGFYYTITNEKELPGPSHQDKKLIHEIMSNLKKLHKKYEWKGTTKINFFYMLYKFRQARGESVHWIPLKTTKAKLKEYESKYKDVCKEYKMEFKPLPSYTFKITTQNGKTKEKTMWGIPPFYWNKVNTIKSLKEWWTKTNCHLHKDAIVVYE